jgi:hypothetical protein
MSAKSASVFLGFLLLAISPAGADWLVTRAGGRVETRGAWQVKGKLVVFTQPNGSLSSLRLADVDLDASRQASEAAKAQAEQPAPAAPEAAKKKRTVLTDKDFKPAAPPAPTADVTVKLAEAAGNPPGPGGPVVVSSWQKVDLPNGAGLAVVGTLQNTSSDMIVNASVEVQLYNDAGERTATAPAILKTVSIQPNGTTEFRATFPGIFIFTEAKFDPRGLPLAVAPAPEAKPEGP